MTYPKQDVLIRRATRRDVPHIVRMLADDVLGQQRERYADPLPQAYYDAFDAIDRDEHNELVVVALQNTVIGTLQLTFLPSLSFQGQPRAQIESVRVDQSYRGQGIGEMLFRWAIERAWEARCHVVQLTTNNVRTDAQRFYERLGFKASHVGMKLDLTQPQSTTGDV